MHKGSTSGKKSLFNPRNRLGNKRNKLVIQMLQVFRKFHVSELYSLGYSLVIL